jgi:DNA polymerase-3 subunit alpha
VASPYVHLHVHTSYSMLDGAAKLRPLVAAAAADGQPALAITDHGNLYGLLEFYDLCKAQGITPILGLEAYQAEESRLDRSSNSSKVEDQGLDVAATGSNKQYYHLSLLCETTEGYRNLIALSSEAFLSGYHYKPRVDWDLLEQYHKGLIATTGCLGGLVLQALLQDRYDLARDRAGRLRDIFGPENLFVELQDHGLPEQRKTNPELVRLARDLDLPIIATNDSHYVEAADALPHDVLLCIQTKAKQTDEKRFRFSSDQHWLKSSAEMRHLFSELPEACDNTLLIAERCQGVNPYPSDTPGGVPRPVLPALPPPDQFAAEQDPWEAWLHSLVWEGARKKYGDPVPQPVQERINYELSIIGSMGFNRYFLIVWDMVNFARRAGIRVGPGRGSAAGSVVTYCLDIARIDPMRYGLLFERFLNPGRKQMPDIDVDFEQERRGEVIRYMSERWGEERVAHIIIFSLIQSRAAIRDANRVLGFEWADGDRLVKMLPKLILGRDTPLAACLEETPGYEAGYGMAAELRRTVETDPQARQVVEVALGIEGLHRSEGIHAGAVIISDRPLTEYLPVQRKTVKGEPGPIVSQYEMHAVEQLGLLKMDVLGLRTLSVIDRTCKLIKETDGIDINPDELPLDDEATYELLRTGDCAGIFQLEQPGIQALVRSIAPTNFNDIGALLALYRPGPMAANMHNEYADRKNGRKPVEYLHPDMEHLLGETYGLMIYQEMIMRVAQHYAGLSLAEADDLRKACGKKDREVLSKYRQRLIDGCETNGFGSKLGQELWDIIEPFADYAFNKSHSFSYGLITYQTAWFKANWPHHYMAGVLSSYSDDTDKLEYFIGVAQNMGLRIVCPDIQRSGFDFSVIRDDNGQYVILCGLGGIRGVGESHVDAILQARRDGPFKGVGDLLRRVEGKTINNTAVLQALVQSGALDCFGHPRKALAAYIPQALAAQQQFEKSASDHDLMLIDVEEVYAPPPVNDSIGEWPTISLLTRERDVLCGFISGHPLGHLKSAIAAMGVTRVFDLQELDRDPRVRHDCMFVGLVRQLESRLTKRGDRMASFQLLCPDGTVSVLVMPKVYTDVHQNLASRKLVRVRGNWRWDEDGSGQLFATSIEAVQLSLDDREPLLVKVPADASEQALDELRQVLSRHPGPHPVVLEMDGQHFVLPLSQGVDPGPDLLGELRRWAGVDTATPQVA